MLQHCIEAEYQREDKQKSSYLCGHKTLQYCIYAKKSAPKLAKIMQNIQVEFHAQLT
jgi:hypothetical protein